MGKIKQIIYSVSSRNFIFFRLFPLLFILAAVLYFNSQIHPKSNNECVTIAGSDHLSIAKPVYETYIQFFSYIVKPGDTFAGILSKFNIPEKQSVTYYSSLKSIGLFSLFPGDSLVLTKDKNDNLKTCSLLSQLNNWYHIYGKDSILHAEKRPLEMTKFRCALKGTLNTSLSEDMYKLGISDALVIKFADIFAWDLNFFMDPKKGDTFEVLFEKNYRENQFAGYGPILAAKYTNGNTTFHAIALFDSEGNVHYYDLNGKSVQKQFLKAPLRYNRVSSSFSYRRKHPILGIYRPHFGIDYAAPQGTPIYSAADGTINFAGINNEYGKQVVISHGASYQTYYGHLYTILPGITKNTRMKQGQMIGTVGSTGLATGPHLDYRMKIGSRFVNPMKISLPSKEGVSPEDMERFVKTKYACISAMESALSQREGCFIIDIIKPENQIKTISKIKVKINTNNGNASHS